MDRGKFAAIRVSFSKVRVNHLVGLDPGPMVRPPAGHEIGYVPIVTRQEKIRGRF